MSTRTTWPRRPLGVNGGELSHPVAPAREGKFPSTGNCAAAPTCCPVESIIPSPATAMHIAPMTRERRRLTLTSAGILFSYLPDDFPCVRALDSASRNDDRKRPIAFVRWPEHRKVSFHRQGMPALTQASSASTNLSCDSGGVVR